MMRRKKPFFFRGSPATSEAPGKSGSTGRASRPFFRTHDIGLAYYISDTVYIMEHGKFVESGKADKVILHPQAAYTNGDITAEEFFNLTGQYPIGYLGAGAGAAAGGGGWMPQGKQGIKTAQENMNKILVSNGYSPIQTDGFNGPETQKAAALVDKILAGEGV